MNDKEMKTAVTLIINEIGDNTTREGTQDTPSRMVRAYKEMFRGYQEPDFKMTEEASKNSINWESFISRNATPKTKKFISFIDDVHNIGLDDAYTKHCDKSTQHIEEWI